MPSLAREVRGGPAPSFAVWRHSRRSFVRIPTATCAAFFELRARLAADRRIGATAWLRRGGSFRPRARWRGAPRRVLSSPEFLRDQLFQKTLLVRREVVLLSLRVCKQHVDERTVYVPVVDHSYAASLSLPAPRFSPAHLPQASRSGDDIACIGVCNQFVLKLRILQVGEQCCDRSREHWRLAKLEHVFKVYVTGGQSNAEP